MNSIELMKKEIEYQVDKLKISILEKNKNSFSHHNDD